MDTRYQSRTRTVRSGALKYGERQPIRQPDWQGCHIAVARGQAMYHPLIGTLILNRRRPTMRLTINLVLLASLPGLFFWAVFNMFLINSLFHRDPAGILMFIGGNWAWYTLIKSCVVFNRKKSLFLSWFDYLGLLAGIAVVGHIGVGGIGTGAWDFLVMTSILYLPPVVLAGVLFKASRMSVRQNPSMC